MPLSSNAKGAIACAVFDKLALERGGIVSIPALDARYDRIMDMQGQLYRVQVKYCDRAVSGCTGSVLVDLASYGSGRLLSNSYSSADVDAIVVYLPSVDALCWLDPDDFHGKSTLTLRTAPPKNGQRAGVRLYTDYLWSPARAGGLSPYVEDSQPVSPCPDLSQRS